MWTGPPPGPIGNTHKLMGFTLTHRKLWSTACLREKLIQPFYLLGGPRNMPRWLATDKESNPDLHRLVTRYQMHKCSVYCKWRYKCSDNTSITGCRFGFPRQVCENPKLKSVQESLKYRRQIYELPRSDSEVRVNDYNPLLLMLWKANIDIQFVAESSLALAHYVSGYVTKAERTCK